ncbi:MAG: Xaa-Pro peptidase family protein [Candidatus Gracilibacteria bacterium]
MPSLLTHPLNIFYLTGVQSSHATLLNTSKKNYLIIDGRYVEKAEKIAKQKNFFVIDPKNDYKKTIQSLLKKHKINTLEYEDHRLTVKNFNILKKTARGLGIKWKPIQHPIEELRAIKSASELKAIQTAQHLTDQIFYSIRTILRQGITEIEVANFIKKKTFDHLNASLAFEPIVAFGQNTSIPHHDASLKKLKKGELILVDMGVAYNGYASDMTRMIFTKTPTQKEEKIYNLVLLGQKTAFDALRPEVMAKTLDTKVRRVFKKAGYPTQFTHSLGHGVGLEIHEMPSLSAKIKTILKPNMVVTLEPGLYFPGKFGVRIEDLVLVTATGAKTLTKTSKKISVISL